MNTYKPSCNSQARREQGGTEARAQFQQIKLATDAHATILNRAGLVDRMRHPIQSRRRVARREIPNQKNGIPVCRKFADSDGKVPEKFRQSGRIVAPEVGLEPTTHLLTPDCSTIELLWNPKAAQSTNHRPRRQTDSGAQKMGNCSILKTMP